MLIVSLLYFLWQCFEFLERKRISSFRSNWNTLQASDVLLQKKGINYKKKTANFGIIDFSSTVDHWLDFDYWIFLDLFYKHLTKGFIIFIKNQLFYDYVTNANFQQLKISSSIKLHSRGFFFILRCPLKLILSPQCSLFYKEGGTPS